MLGGDGLLVGFVAYFVGLGGNEVDKLSAAVDHQLPGVVGHSDVREGFFNHLVDGRSGDREVVVVSRGGSHCGKKQNTKTTQISLPLGNEVKLGLWS